MLNLLYIFALLTKMINNFKYRIKMKEVKVKINVFDKVNVDVEGLKNHIDNVICNPIELCKYVRDWLHSTNCLGGTYNEEYDKIYNNICNRWKKLYVKENNVDNVTVRYSFSEDNWDMVVEIFKNCN